MGVIGTLLKAVKILFLEHGMAEGAELFYCLQRIGVDSSLDLMPCRRHTIYDGLCVSTMRVVRISCLHRS